MYHKEDGLDRYDFLMAAVTGIGAGLLDALWVDKPGISKLSETGRSVLDKTFTDKQVDRAIMWMAEKNGWEPPAANKNNVKSAIGYLEKYRVNYDQTSTFGKNGTNGLVDHLYTDNHHLKSLGHSPDFIGLFFSVLNQFTGTSTFISNGKITTINSKSQELIGDSFPAKVFCGCSNWFWHLASDVAGSSGTKYRGSGIPIPFYNLFLLCDFGQVGQYRETYAKIMTQVFENGYDLRHAISMTIPMFVGELLTALCWSFKRVFYHKWEWHDCLPWEWRTDGHYRIPSESYSSYRRSRLIHSSAFCMVDGAHAYFKGHGDPVEIILHMNLIAWLRLVKLIIQEILITYGRTYENVAEDLALINKALQEELDNLKSIDYQQWQIENELVKDFNQKLNETSDERVIGNLAGEYIFSHGGTLKPRDEFGIAFRNNGNLL